MEEKVDMIASWLDLRFIRLPVLSGINDSRAQLQLNGGDALTGLWYGSFPTNCHEVRLPK